MLYVVNVLKVYCQTKPKKRKKKDKAQQNPHISL